MLLISVIITMYNTEKYASKCIDSAINLRKHNDVEIIVVNDGSIDDTELICQGYCNRGLIKYIRQDNSGVSVARNRGIIEANGDYIMFVDGDDWVDEKIVDVLIKHCKNGVDIASCCCMINDCRATLPEHFYMNSFTCEDEDSKLELYKQLLDPSYGQTNKPVFAAIGVPWGKLYRREFLLTNGLRFNPELRRMQDNIFNMKAFAAASIIVYDNQPLYNYRAEHISGYKKPYSSDNLYKVHLERREFFEHSYLSQHNELMDYYYLDSVHLHIEADKYEILTYNMADAINKLALNKRRFSCNIPEKYWQTNKVSRLFNWCIKREWFLSLFVIYRIYCLFRSGK